MATQNVRIRALNRQPIRIGGKVISSTKGTAVDINNGAVRRDLHKFLGGWVVDNGSQVKIAMVAADTAGGIAAWANPEGATIIVTNVILDVTTVATGACTVSAGVAANGTTLASNLISGQDVHSATGCFTSAGKAARATSSQFVTVSTASGASAGLVGNVYIAYIIE